MRVLLSMGAVLAAVVVATIATAETNADATTETVNGLLDQAQQPLGDLPIKLANDDDSGRDGAADRSDDGAQSTALLSIVTAPVAAISKSLIDLGLEILNGFYAGMAGGVRTFGAAATTVAGAPAQSALIGAATLTLLGLGSLLASALKRYGSFAAIPLFSRIAKSAVLDNQVRNQIFELIKANPGINTSEIARRLDIAWGTSTHHLQKLRQERLIGIRDVGHQKCYFPNGGTYTPREMDVLSATKSPTAKRIAEYLVAGGSRSHHEIAEGLNLSPALVSFHMRKLVGAGIIERRRDGRRSIFTPLETNLAPTPRPMQLHVP